MKIFIDINHPSDVHLFRNFINIMKNRDHSFFITARDKDVAQQLLTNYKIDFVSRGKGGKGILGKIIYMLKADLTIWRYSRKFKPDLFISFGELYLAHVSKLVKKPYIAFDDTEHNKYEHFLYIPFADTILTPSCFTKHFNNKQIYINGYKELCYLNNNYFKNDDSIWEYLKLKKNDKYVILRFVAWEAGHDRGQSGLSLDLKNKIVKELSKYLKIFISSEGELPPELQQYNIDIPPEKMHDVLAHAFLFIGEGATMASECACLGTPAIYVNSLQVGYCTEQEKKYNLIYGFRNSAGVMEKTMELLKTPSLKEEFHKRQQKMLSDKIDVTAYMVWFVENYPKSFKIMKNNPDYQYNFN